MQLWEGQSCPTTRGEEHARRLAYRRFVWNLRHPKETHIPLDEFIINVYCEICEAYAAVVSTPLRRRGFAPTLSDQEVLTLEMVGAYLGMSQDKQIWCYFSIATGGIGSPDWARARPLCANRPTCGRSSSACTAAESGGWAPQSAMFIWLMAFPCRFVIFGGRISARCFGARQRLATVPRKRRLTTASRLWC